VSVTRRKELDEKDVATQPKHVSGINKMYLAHDRNPLNQPIMKVDIEARNPPIGSNGNQSTAQIPMCDNER